MEGHIFTCTLLFNGKLIRGPRSCHDNTIELKNALHKADERFDIELYKQDHTVEGHTRYISVKSGGNLLLDKLSTYGNMGSLVVAINAVLAIDG